MLCLEVRCHENSLRRVGVGHFYPRDATLARILAMARCQYVCLRLSVFGVLLKRLDGSSWFLVWRLLSTYPTLCYNEIVLSVKIRVLISGILFLTRDVENFAAKGLSSKCVNNFDRQTWTLIGGTVVHEPTGHQPFQFRCSRSSREADALDQWTRRVTGSTCFWSVQFVV